MAKIPAYCSPAMLSALTDLAKGGLIPVAVYWPLRSRGWINKDSQITEAGLTYLNKRGIVVSLNQIKE